MLRDYDPVTGRYVQSDPIGLDGGMNTFLFTNSSPIVNIDPNGLWIIRYGNVTSRDKNLISYALKTLKARLSSSVVNYFNLFGVDIKTAVNGTGVPKITFLRDTVRKSFGWHRWWSGVTINIQAFDNNKILTNTNYIASTLIHEIGHWADFKRTKSRPSLSAIQSVVPNYTGCLPNPDDSGGKNSGAYYGYAAEVALYGRFINPKTRGGCKH